MLCVYADLCCLLAATNQYSVFIGQKMQLTGCHNGNEKRNATCAASNTSKVLTQDALVLIFYSMTYTYELQGLKIIEITSPAYFLIHFLLCLTNSRGLTPFSPI